MMRPVSLASLITPTDRFSLHSSPEVGPRALLACGDAVEVLRATSDRSFQVAVTDPPYGLNEITPDDFVAALRCWLAGDVYRPRRRGGFRGRAWDAWVPGPELWREVHRCLVPGAFLVCFASPRTAGLMSAAIQIAGFQAIDLLAWIRGQNVPKGKNVGRLRAREGDDAWRGYQTRLKSLVEPLLVFQRPLDRPLDANLDAHRAGALNLDGCRVEGGRLPSNVLFAHEPECLEGHCKEGCAVAELDQQSGVLKSGSRREGVYAGMGYGGVEASILPAVQGSTGGASRFYYCATASPAERSLGLGGDLNDHPTVKPLALMRWVVRLASPPQAVLLDPLCGSGTTALAGLAEGLSVVGVDEDPATVGLALARLSAWPEYARASAR